MLHIESRSREATATVAVAKQLLRRNNAAEPIVSNVFHSMSFWLTHFFLDLKKDKLRNIN